MTKWTGIGVVLWLSWAGCGGDAEAVDAAGIDVGNDAFFPIFETSGPWDTGGPTCSTEGQASCESGNVRVCCGGAVMTVIDGPCFPSPSMDAGMAACAGGAYAGCPCTEEGATTCAFPFDQWLRECVGGVWVERPSQWCCPD